MKKELQDDVSALYSLVSLDRDGYREFGDAKASRTPDSAVEAPLDSQVTEAKADGANDENALRQVRKPNQKRSISRVGPGRQALKNTRLSKQGAGSTRSSSHHSLGMSCIFAASGGVGATTAAAALALACSRQNENVLLLDGRATHSLLPAYFGGRLGLTGTKSFAPAQSYPHIQVHVGGWDPALERQTEASDREWLRERISETESGIDRLIIDAWPQMSADTFEYLAANGQCVVIATPDLQSVVGVERIASRLRESEGNTQPVLVLNKFDSTVPFHNEILAWLQEQCSEHFKYFTVARGDEPAEALAEGLTVLDFASECAISRDWNSIGAFLCNHSQASRESKSRSILRAIRA